MMVFLMAQVDQADMMAQMWVHVAQMVRLLVEIQIELVR